jgi:dethiobiotin synthetase
VKIFVAGTDTDVGKTVFSAGLVGALRGAYWKPIQAGTLDRSDSMTVARLSGLPASKILTEAYRLTTACSPHRAAELDGLRIDQDHFRLPDADPLIVEGAGGLLVPINRKALLIDLIGRWKLPVVLVARTQVGTINHSLLALEALRCRAIPLVGIAFVGESNSDSEATICEFGEVKRLGRLPMVDPLDRETLERAFAANFDLSDFQ